MVTDATTEAPWTRLSKVLYVSAGRPSILSDTRSDQTWRRCWTVLATPAVTPAVFSRDLGVTLLSQTSGGSTATYPSVVSICTLSVVLVITSRLFIAPLWQYERWYILEEIRRQRSRHHNLFLQWFSDTVTLVNTFFKIFSNMNNSSTNKQSENEELCQGWSKRNRQKYLRIIVPENSDVVESTKTKFRCESE